MINPFDEEDASYSVLVNAEGQYSLWPATVDIPSGWTAVLKEDSRASCIDFINLHWIDMRPKSLIH